MTDNRTTERVDHPPRVRGAIDELMREKDAIDNRTTELRVKLTERGIEYATNDHMGVCETSWNGFTAMQLTPGAKLMMVLTPEQAIAATLGELIIRCRDCKHATISTTGVCKYCEMFVLPDTDGYGADPKVNLPLDFFCGFAERKEVDE